MVESMKKVASMDVELTVEEIEGFYLDPIFSIRFENTKKLK